MVKYIETGRTVTIEDQLKGEEGPVILINTFVSNPQDEDKLLAAWAVDAALLKRQPGFISTQLHRGIAKSGVFVNYAVWETIPLYRAALNVLKQNPPSDFPEGVTESPHLFKTIAVPGICVG